MDSLRSVTFNEGFDDDISSIGSSGVSGAARTVLRNGRYSNQQLMKDKMDTLFHSSKNCYKHQDSEEDTVRHLVKSFPYPEVYRSLNNQEKNHKVRENKHKMYSGHLLVRHTRVSLALRLWKEKTWLFVKPATVLMFATKEDSLLYHDPSLSSDQKSRLVKFALDFDTTGKLKKKMKKKHRSFENPPIPTSSRPIHNVVYIISDINSKSYRNSMAPLHYFNIREISDMGSRVLAKFASADYKTVKNIHGILKKCTKKVYKNTGDNSVSGSELNSSCTSSQSTKASSNSRLSTHSNASIYKTMHKG